jgi:hypothetical protein
MYGANSIRCAAHAPRMASETPVCTYEDTQLRRGEESTRAMHAQGPLERAVASNGQDHPL